MSAKRPKNHPLKVLKKLDGKFMMQELASASRARDFINHLESRVCRETGYVEQYVFFEKLSEIEANVQRESTAIFDQGI